MPEASVVQRLRSALTPVNESKWIAGIAVILLNVLGRTPKIHLTSGQRSVVDRLFGEEVFVFTAAFVTTRDVIESLLITAVFYAGARLFRHEYPEPDSPTAPEGGVTNQAIGQALDTLEKAYQDRLRRIIYKGGALWQLF
jgi:hypothetical protein